MSWLHVARKDALVELRSREMLIPLVLTALLVATVGLLAFHDIHDHATVGAAVLWTGLSFAAAIGLGRAFGAERDRGTLDTLLTLPLDRSGLYLGKLAASLGTLLVTAAVLVPLYFLASGEALPAQWPGLLALVLLGSVGLAATGTMLSLLASQTRTRDVMLPVLLFPLLAPLLIATVHGTADVLRGEPFSEWRPELLLLLGYDVAFAAASALLFEEAVGS